MNGASVEGTFWLTTTGTDGSFDTYAVSRVSWFFSANGTVKSVVGSGTYKVDRHSLQQELSLDLQIASAGPQHFDSGLVSDPVLFPKIEATISLHGQYCFDTVFNLVASPVSVPPLRAVVADPQTVVLSWPMSPGGFVVQRCSNLAVGIWTTVTDAPTTTDSQNRVVLGRSLGSEFYRLVPTN
jgi:hypothetical protein